MLGALLLAAVVNAAPEDLSAYSFIERPGGLLPLQLPLRDASGQVVTLGELPHGKPLILVLAYFHCENLCGVVRQSLFRALKAGNLQAGRDYVLAVMSIDPQETSEQAREAEAQDDEAFGATDPRFVHYLTGSEQATTSIASAVGFRDRYDSSTHQFVHPAGIVFATAGGMISNYLLGVGYTPAAVQSAVQRAGAGTLAAVSAPLLLICFHFDPTTGRYSLEILKVVRLAAILTVAAVIALLILLGRGPRASA